MTKSKLSKENIALLGCGMSGSAFLAHLACNFDSAIGSQLSITIIEQDDYVGKGYPYNIRNETFILNTEPDFMGIRYREEFTDWLVRRNLRTVDVPRRLYGDYICEVLKESIDILKSKGTEVNFANALAINVTQIERRYHIELKSGELLSADWLVLAVGSSSNTPYSSLTNARCLKLNDVENFRSESFRGEIIVIGTQQSAIDAAIYLCNNFDVHVSLVSRRGLLPISKGIARRDYENRYLVNQPETMGLAIEKFKTMLDLEILDSQVNEALSSAEISSQTLEQSIGKAKLSPLGWQAVMCNTTWLLQDYYSKLDYQNKRRFLEKVFTPIRRLRSAIPLSNAEKIFKLISLRRVSVLSSVRSIDYITEESRFCVAAAGRRLKSEFLINATGQDYYGLEHSLLKKITFLSRNPLGGFYINTDTMQPTNEDGKIKNPSCFCLGAGTLGDFLIVNSAEVCCNQARRAAIAIAIELKRPKPIG